MESWQTYTVVIKIHSRCRPGVQRQAGGPATATESSTSGGESAVEISKINADAAGSEYDNLNNEYAVIKNTGSTPVDISGWTLSEGDDMTYTFAEGVELEPGETITVHTGSGTDSDADVYWGLEKPVWNNNGDTGTLRNANGETVDTLSY